jgi:hypothetical protein
LGWSTMMTQPVMARAPSVRPRDGGLQSGASRFSKRSAWPLS